jgi:hypothetical protein
MKPTLLLRSAAVVTLLLGVGHMLGKPWTPTYDPQAVAVVETMKSHRVRITGFDRTFMDFYLGFGWMVGIYLLGQAVLLWMLVGFASSEPARVRRIVAVFFIVNVVQTIIAAEYLFTVPLVMSGMVALCLGAAVVIPSGTATPATEGPDRAPQV